MEKKRQAITRKIHWSYSAINVGHKITSLIMKLQKKQKKLWRRHLAGEGELQ